MMIEEVAKALRLMGREIVDDDVDLATFGLAGDDVTEKGEESSVVWRAAVLSSTSPLLAVQSGVEGQGAVAEVFESTALRPAGGERKNRIEPFEWVDRGLLV